MGSPVAVSRKKVRSILVGLLIVSAAFAAWAWLRPYEWSADSGAACRITGCQVVQDHSNYWVNLQLKVNRGAKHDDKIPVKLITSSGREITGDVTLVSEGAKGEEDKQVREIWLKFWLEKEDLKGALKLKINKGKLSVRKGSGEPALGAEGSRFFSSHGW